MLQLSSQLALGYTAMLVHAVAHWRRLDRPAVRDALARQVVTAGVRALPMVALVALGFGLLVPTQALALLGADNELVLKTVVWGGVREIGPLLAAGLMITRSAVSMAAEVALLRMRKGIKGSLRSGLAAEEEVVLPRVLGMAVSGALLVVYFQAIAVASGLLATAWMLGTPVQEEAHAFLDAGQWWHVPLAMGKGAVFGLGIGAVACYHGLAAEWRLDAVPRATVAAGMGSVAFVMVAEALTLALRWA